MKKILIVGVGVMALSIGMAIAEGEALAVPVAKAPVPKLELKDVMFTGVIVKGKALDKVGNEMFSIKTDDGLVVRLPMGKSDADFKSMLGRRVKIVGKATETDKDGKKHLIIRSLTTVEKVEAPATATPVAQ